jgi:formamidopyrimidine-DNA glycosylase
MPEGPEVAYISQEMNKAIHGKKLQGIRILKGRYITHGPPVHYKDFQNALPLTCNNVTNKGKVIFINFSDGWTVIVKLGLTGWLYTTDIPQWKPDYKNVLFYFSNNQNVESSPSAHTMTFTDVRSYGTLTFTKDPSVVEKEHAKLGLNIMDANTTWPVFWKAVQIITTKKTAHTETVENLITDQKKLVCGIGNYLKAEVFYMAKIAPMRKVATLTEKEWRVLFTAMKKKTTQMIKALHHEKTHPGTYFNSMKIYQQDKDPLGNEVKKYKTATGRTTHWVPAIQK